MRPSIPSSPRLLDPVVDTSSYVACTGVGERLIGEMIVN